MHYPEKRDSSPSREAMLAVLAGFSRLGKHASTRNALCMEPNDAECEDRQRNPLFVHGRERRHANMAGTLRIESHGAVCHGTARGNARHGLPVAGRLPES